MLKTTWLLLMTLPIALIASPRKSKDIRAQISAPVIYVRERSSEDLTNFGLQERAYTLMLGDKRIVIGVDYIRNLSGITEELPSDLSDYVINAITKISSQFGAYRKYPATVAIPGAFLTAPPTPESTKSPGIDFWISGSLERASEVTKDQSTKSFDGAGGGGHSQWNNHLGRNRMQSVKSLTVTFTLEGPDRVSIPGASATYRIDVAQLQRERAFSVYVAGSGLSLDSTVTITQNLDDAIYDATAASVIHVLGNALLIPYYRCSSVFLPDEELDRRVHDNLARLTKQQLEQNIKLWMMIDGYPVAPRDLLHLTDHDRAVVEVEMYHRSLAIDDGGALAEFAFQLWKNLDYTKGAPRVRAYLAEMDRIRREEEAARQAAAAEAAAKATAEAAEKAFAEAAHVAAETARKEQQSSKAIAKPVRKRSSKRPRAASSVN